MQWSPGQARALDRVGKWLRDRDKPWLYIDGPAGTGKSTIAKHLAGSQCTLFASFTGKAARVMRKYGCEGATTIHSLIYQVSGRSPSRLVELLAQLERDPLNPVLQQEVEDERASLRQPHFTLNPDSPVREANLVVIDEVSMVGRRLAEDLLSFGTPVLVIGDRCQLPPVKDAGYFTNREPDVQLTDDDIRRQALDSPVLWLATRVRQGKALEPGTYGESRVVRAADFDRGEIQEEDQVLVGRNKTRVRANHYLRGRFLGEDLPAISVGERLVCLRNRHSAGLLNGALFRVQSVYMDDGETADLVIRDEDDETELDVTADLGCLDGGDSASWDRDIDRFDYGYALTTHKSQGSQWDSVVVIDESKCFRGNESRWRYTAVTRAVEKVCIVL